MTDCMRTEISELMEKIIQCEAMMTSENKRLENEVLKLKVKMLETRDDYLNKELVKCIVKGK